MSSVKSSLPETSADAQYDAYAKDIISHRWVLAQILRLVLPELKDKSVEEVMAMIGPDIRRNVPLEPGKTNQPATPDPNSRVMGLNTEDKAPDEGAMVYDFLFDLRIPTGVDGQYEVLRVDMEPMHLLSNKYKLGDRRQVSSARIIGSQVGREITHQEYSNAVRSVSFWICCNRPVNTVYLSTPGEKLISENRNSSGELIRDRRLESHRFLTREYTIGVRNEGPTADDKNYRALFQFLAALFSATLRKEEKIRILDEEFGLGKLEKAEQDKIREGVEIMSAALAAIINSDLEDKIELQAGTIQEQAQTIEQITQKLDEKDRALDEKDRALDEKDRALHQKDRALDEKDRALDEKNRALDEKDRTIQELRAMVEKLCGPKK